MRLWTLLAAVGAFVIFAIAPEANGGGGTAITACGQVVTTSAFLAQSLNCGLTDGITVGADGVSIDLRGFVLSAGHESGIVTGGFDNVTIKNGIVRSSRYCVRGSSNHLSVANLVCSGNEEGILFGGQVTISSSTVSGNLGYGVSAGSVFISDSDISGNLTTGVHSQNAAAIKASTITGNGGDGVIIDDGPGSSISSTVASGNTRDGIFVVGAGVKISKTTVAGNGLTGINASGSSPSLTAVTATGNKDYGLYVVGAFAKIASSNVRGNGHDGIYVFSTGASLTKNVANANGFGSLGGYEDGDGLGIVVGGYGGSPPVGANSAHGNDNQAECDPTFLC